MRTFSVLFIFSILLANGACLTVNTNIIQGPLSSSSPLFAEPFQKIGDHYYIVEDKLKLDWISAEYYCRRHDAHLLSIDTESEWNALSDYLISKHIGIHDIYWIGASDFKLDKKFFWINSGKEVSITKWGKGEPNNLGGNEKCVHLYRRKKIYMNDRVCEYKGYFICKAYPQNIILSVLS